MQQFSSVLASEALRLDPRITQARQLFLGALREHQSALTQIRPPIAERKSQYQELLETFAARRGSKLWLPYLGSGIGNGALVELLDGSVKYDLISGIGVHYLGHSHPDLMGAVFDAAVNDLVMQGNLQQNKETLDLLCLLTDLAKMDHCFLATSGAMANENAFKIAFQKRFPANRILAFDHCFAGRTWSLSQVTDKPSFREGLPLNVQVDYLPFFDPAHPEASIQQTVQLLNQYLERYPKQYAAMLFEFVQGENGFYPGSHDFFASLMEILRKEQVTVIADEVQTFGRTPALFAYQYFQLEKFIDIAVIGKVAQVCATLFNKDHAPHLGLLSQTFTSSTAAIQAALIMLRHLTEEDYFGPNGKIVKMERAMTARLSQLAKKYPNEVRGPFGIGSMIAFTPLDGELQRVTQFIHELFDAGVIAFIAGSKPTRARFLLPVGFLSEHDLDVIIQVIEETIVKMKRYKGEKDQKD